jgi:hypothetical protein
VAWVINVGPCSVSWLARCADKAVGPFSFNEAKSAALAMAGGGACDYGVKEPIGPPQHEGFGTLLANQIVTGQFGREISHDWKPAGLVVRLSVPIDRIAG